MKATPADVWMVVITGAIAVFVLFLVIRNAR
jgi:hypothetical protein